MDDEFDEDDFYEDDDEDWGFVTTNDNDIEEVLCENCSAPLKTLPKCDFLEPLNAEERRLVQWLTDGGTTWYEANQYLRAVIAYAKEGIFPNELP